MISWLRGQDNWWDIINYHVYNPWALLHHRWGKDLFAAGIQGYFHPLIDVPYYLVSEVWLPGHPRLVSALAGLPFGLLAFTSFLISRRLFDAIGIQGRIERALLVALTVLVSVTGVSAWTQAGTTTNEVTISAIVLFGLVAFLKMSDRRQGGRPAVGYALATGCLLGMAAGLKLTAAIYAPAMGLVLLATSRDLKSALTDGVLYLLGWVLVFGLVYGPWAWHLVEYTGNPFFPKFNDIFHSAFSAPVGGRVLDYMPKNLGQWLIYPFYWLDVHHPTVYNHLSFRDGRILLFYIVALAYFAGAAIRRMRGLPRFVPGSIHAATLFCTLAYVIWLFMFSMLRYGVVIEVLASIMALVLLVSGAKRLRRLGAYSALGVALIVTLLMVSTVYPDVPRIGYSQRVYVSKVPSLPKGSLIVLANQPMGLLAPLIQSVDGQATFIGLPRCFEKNGWCFNGFYSYGLGKELRHKIMDHEGPIFVAYYKNRIPDFPQLALFRLQVEMSDCREMTTNATPSVALCPARYVPAGQPLVQMKSAFKLGLKISYRLAGARLDAHWLVNQCSTTEHHGELRFEWHMPADQSTVLVYLKGPPSYKRITFAGGGANGTATTGVWVRAQQTFIFVGHHGQTLATATTGYVTCNSP